MYVAYDIEDLIKDRMLLHNNYGSFYRHMMPCGCLSGIKALD